MCRGMWSHLEAAWCQLHVIYEDKNSGLSCIMTLHSDSSLLKACRFIRICVPAFKWLQGFNELREKLILQYKVSVDNRQPTVRIIHIHLYNNADSFTGVPALRVEGLSPHIKRFFFFRSISKHLSVVEIKIFPCICCDNLVCSW